MKMIKRDRMEKSQLELWNNLKETNTLREVQNYVKSVNKIRGFHKQEITKVMLLLLEEVGELAKAIRRNATDIAIDKKKINHYDTVEEEVADVFYMLLCVCNDLDIDLYSCIKEKEAKNIKRIWEKE